MAPSSCLLLALLASAGSPCTGNAFLKAHTHHEGGNTYVSADFIEKSLLEEVEGTLGGAASSRVLSIQEQLRSMFTALPKNEHGNLDHVTVRYALHRLFGHRHGWSIRGLDAAGGSWNTTTTTGVLQDQVPAYLQGLFEERLGGRGMGLQEISVMGATIEHLIHDEAISRLHEAYTAHRMLPSELLGEKEAHKIMDTYMMVYILGENITGLSVKDVETVLAEMPELYMQWNSTQQYVGAELKERMDRNHGEASFATLAKTADHIGENFGRFQDEECKDMKKTLLAMGDRGTGRVALADFYRPALNGHWHFQESPTYLRELGILDETDPKDPRIVVPNYIYSQANCIATSKYYAICCMDECEQLMGQVEREVGAPEAPVERILDVVARTPSDTQAAPRNLSRSVRDRLEEVAASHGGNVQLHGRLFTQWMHHAYPRECAMPLLPGSSTQRFPDEWEQHTGADPVATNDEMQHYVSMTSGAAAGRAADSTQQGSWDETIPWSMEEELLVIRPLAPAAKSLNKKLPILVGVPVVAAVALLLALARPSLGTPDVGSSVKLMV